MMARMPAQSQAPKSAKGYRFVFSARWARYIALALVATVVCLLLADWQDHRRAQRDAEIERIETNYSGPIEPLESVLPDRTSVLDEDDEWTRVEVSGEYDSEATVLARNRSLNGQAGFYVVVPFVLDTGGTIAVVRGWVPTSEEGTVPAAESLPAAPAGDTTVEMRLRPKQDGSDDTNAPGIIKAIDPAVIPGMSEPYTEVYGQMASEDPPAADDIEALPEPDTSPGSHLSYTFQWIAFGVMILGGLAYAARREKKSNDAAAERAAAERAAAEGETDVPRTEYVVVDKDVLMHGGRAATAAAPRYGREERVRSGDRVRAPSPPRRRSPSDEELEDALLEDEFTAGRR